MNVRSTSILTLLLLSSITPLAAASPRLGMVSIDASGTACVTFHGAPVAAGTHLVFILFSPPRVVDGVVRAPSQTPCNPALQDSSRSYAVELRHSMGDMPEVGIAVDSPGARVEYADGEFVMHTPDARTPLSFRRCTSQEGLHLTTWRGNRRTWHGYWYLGYDVDADCTDPETRAAGAP